MTRAQIESKLASEYARANRAAEIGKTAAWFKDLRDLYVQHGVANDHEQAEAYDDAREDTIKSVSDAWKADSEKRTRYGGERYKQAVHHALKAKGLANEADEAALSRSQMAGFGLGIAAISIGRGVMSSVNAGRRMGDAAGHVAQGLNRGVMDSAQGFITAGEAALGLFLSPFGKTGGAIAKAMTGLGKMIMGGFQGIGSVGVAGLRVAGSLIGGAGGLLAGAAGAGLGAVAGSLLPGIGTLAGAAAGGALMGSIANAVGTLVSSIGGAVGQMLGAIGSAFGQLGSGIAEIITNVTSALSDLIQTGKAFASATFSIMRGSGMSAASASGTVALSRILTGGDTAFNSTFAGYGMMAPYQTARAREAGLNVGSHDDFLSIVAAGQSRWNQFGGGWTGAIRRRQMLSVIAPGSEDAIGNLYSNGMGAQAVAMARATAPSGRELKNDALMGFKLDMVGRQLDAIKMKFLTDLMPTINLVMNAFSKFFNKNEGNLIAGLQAGAKWLFTSFPTVIKGVIDGFFGLAASMGQAMIPLAEFGRSVYITLVTVANVVKATLGGMLLGLATTLAAIPGVGGILAVSGTLGKLTTAGVGLMTSPINPKGMDDAFGKMGMMGMSMTGKAQDAQGKFDKGWDKYVPSKSDLEKQWASGAGSGKLQIESTVIIKPENNPDALYKFKADLHHHIVNQAVREISRSPA